MPPERTSLDRASNNPLKFDRPENGLRGLKHWRHDIRSGFMVALISLPFSMGIAITSGAPAVCGIVSAIIAGFVLPFLGGSYVTISGPAAGLAPVLYSGIVALGHGKLEVGYPRILVAILLAGMLQFVLARLKIARLSAIFPAAAIEGMLAAIGLMIIVKQIPLFFGETFHSHEFWGILEEAPHRVSGIDPQVFGLGIGCIALIFSLAAIPGRLFKLMPPPVWVFIAGTLVSATMLELKPQHLIHVPEAPLANGIVLPDVAGIWNDRSTWISLALITFTLVLIDGTESLATIAAVDKLDPFRRKSDPDRSLLAMGASNISSSLLGGLTIIPGIVKSTANILGGGRTQWANFYNACFLLSLLVFARDLINMAPTCVLASILVFVGYKLCGPKVWRHMAHMGREQFVIFAITVLVTVTTDLLLGIVVGVGLKFGLCLWNHARFLQDRSRGVLQPAFDLFRNPVRHRGATSGSYRLEFEGPLVCFNLFHVMREMDRLPADARDVELWLGEGVTLVDHTSCEYLWRCVDESQTDDGERRFTIHGLRDMRPMANHRSATHVANRSFAGSAAHAS